MERLFTLIKRINSALLLLGLLGLGAFIAWNIWSSNQWQSSRAVPIPATQAGEAKPVLLEFGQIRNICGSDTQMLELSTRGDSGKFSSGGYGSETRNVLFLSGKDKTPRWLFPVQSNLILTAEQLRQESEACGSKKAPASALFFEYISNDSNGDGKLSRDDRSRIALAKPDGTGLTEVLDGVSRVLSREMLDSQHLTLIYQKDRTIHHARFSLATLSKELDQEIVTVPEEI
ncbi:hypothetical protein [Azovibrio restrictus]|uniref:hypothetical protein n=1 Tax=Azovibrio restrictus TaxID=146938 RepID=UPI0026E9ECBE|nr:hypothetical protein [Azovibrio restrictus]MDD3482310.1 hypothetical protein [Azovibrio restrictus]